MSYNKVVKGIVKMNKYNKYYFVNNKVVIKYNIYINFWEIMKGCYEIK